MARRRRASSTASRWTRRSASAARATASSSWSGSSRPTRAGSATPADALVDDDATALRAIGHDRLDALPGRRRAAGRHDDAARLPRGRRRRRPADRARGAAATSRSPPARTRSARRWTSSRTRRWSPRARARPALRARCARHAARLSGLPPWDGVIDWTPRLAGRPRRRAPAARRRSRAVRGARRAPPRRASGSSPPTPASCRPRRCPVAEAVGRDEWIEANLALAARRAGPGRRAASARALGPLGGIVGTGRGRAAGRRGGRDLRLPRRARARPVRVPGARPGRARRGCCSWRPTSATPPTALDADPDQLLRWVALHETTHALQFGGVPWLREHIAGTVRELLGGAVASTRGRLLRIPDLDDLRGARGHRPRGRHRRRSRSARSGASCWTACRRSWPCSRATPST